MLMVLLFDTYSIMKWLEQFLLEEHYIKHVFLIETAWLHLSLGVCHLYIFECMAAAI